MPQSAKALLDYLSRELALLYKPSEARSIALWLIEFCTGLSRTSILTGSTLPPNQPDWEVLLARLRRYEPLQYVLGQTVFRELRFEVNPSVLIPRPETEELVALVLDTALQAGGPLRLLDIGTGSGCIAVSLAAALPQSSVTAWDVSAEALAVAQRNAALNGVVIQVEEADILSENFRQSYPQVFDIVVSNPPYVAQEEATQMHANVLDHEPHLALFVPDADPLVFYRAIAAFCQTHLAPRGYCFVEINERFGVETTQLFTNQGFATELVKDFHGKDRFVKARRVA
jgi:release factor glutamine methyltransferase